MAALAALGSGLRLAGPARAEPPLLHLATGDLPPYATAARADKGLALAVVQRALERAGFRVQFHFMPWSRALAETRDGRYDATAHWGATAERRGDFLLSDNLYTERWLLLHRRDLPLDWRVIADLRPYRLGLLRDYTYTPELWAAARGGQLRYEQPHNDVAALRMLLRQRIDVLPLDRNVACDLLARQFTPAEAGLLTAHPRTLTDSFTTHVLFPPALPRSAALREAFNRELAQLRATGEYERMTRGAVRCPPHWPALEARP